MKYFEVRKARIEIIPMIDIMFFLLVFFIMITLHMIPSSGVTSSLAKSSTATQLNQPKMVVTVDAAGTIQVDGAKIALEALTAMLKAKGTNTIVTSAGSKDTSLQNLMKVMDACRQAGVSQIGLAAQKQ
ncbi:MAG: biopolymer transporter ExbD [Burkholderiales bacterium]|nr:biopolymer transporter ExbD [Burkholderiales bacterium]